MNCQWQQFTLKDISEVKGGKRLPKGEKFSDKITPFRYIRVSDMGQFGLVDSKIQYIPERIYTLLSNYQISSNDVYISIAGTIGKAGQVPAELNRAILTENACKLILKDNVDKTFLTLILNSPNVQKQIARLTKKMGQPKLALFRVEQIKINLPTNNEGKLVLDEQKRIANKLTALFAEIDKAIQKIKEAKKQSSKLLNSYLKEFFERTDDTFKQIKLEEIAEYVNGKAFKPSQWEREGLPIIRIQNLNDPIASYNYSTKTHEQKYMVKNGDVLVAWSASLGVYIWNGNGAWLNQHIFRVDFIGNNFNKNYYVYSLNYFLNELLKKVHGATMKHITRKDFLKITIPVPIKNNTPDIKRQVEIANSFFAIEEKKNILLKKYDMQLQHYEKLKQSLLNQAFEGKL